MQTVIDRKINGMTCGNCALTITNYLKKNGAIEMVANAGTGDLHFVVSSNEKADQLLHGIETLGYQIMDEENDNNEASDKSSYSLEKVLFIICLIFWLPLIAHMFLSWHWLHNPWVQVILCAPVYAIGVYYFGKSALRSLRNGIPNMDVLVFVGATAAFVYSLIGWYLHPNDVHQYLFFETAASIITLVLFGNFLEEYSVRSTTSAIKALMKFQKTKANLILIDSLGKESIHTIENKFIKVNDLLLVNTGDQIPTDGEIVSGIAHIDESMMTGESLPVEKIISSKVIGGSILKDGSIRMKATAVGNKTVLANIIQMVNQAQAAKPPMQKLADKISAVFVPLVISIAVLTFIINYALIDKSLQEAMMRTIAVMVIACPCAMGLATPAAIMVGLGRAARNGILIKGGDTLEQFKNIKQFVFDKTGTLTTGLLQIDKYQSTLEDQQFKEIVASLEKHSSHPIAKSVASQWTDSSGFSFTDIQEVKGMGIYAMDKEKNQWIIGSYRVLPNETNAEHDVFLLRNDEVLGWIDMKDELRNDAKDCIKKLSQQGYDTVLLSGDRTEKCNRIANELGITKVYSEQLPAQKLSILDDLMQQAPTAMIGDGVNDAPSLAKATIGISLSDASEIAKQSAQVILLKNNLAVLPMAIGLGRHTYLTIKQNLFWAFTYNLIAIPVAAAGYLTPTWGAGIMALSDVVLIVNSLRLNYKKVNK